MGDTRYTDEYIKGQRETRERERERERERGRQRETRMTKEDRGMQERLRETE